MRRLLCNPALLACVAGTLGARAARADTLDPFGYEWQDARFQSEIGVTLLVGGGAARFVDSAVRDVAGEVSGLWDFRATLGSRIPIGLDIGYTGTASGVNSLVGAQSGTLIGTTVEGALRFNILPHYELNPYVFAGVGWQRYDVTGGRFSVSDTGIAGSDNLLEVPIGGGLQYRYGGFVADAHVVFRTTFGEGLVLENPRNGSMGFVPMSSWAGSGNLGFEF